MPSSYTGGDVLKRNADATYSAVPNPVVKIYNGNTGTLLDTINGDASGHFLGGTVSVAAGTPLVFQIDLGAGRTGFSEENSF